MIGRIRRCSDMQLAKSSVAVITVRAFDSIVCLKLFDPGNDVFVVFNPRPSPDGLQNGMAMSFSKSVMQTIHRLCLLMPSDARGDYNGNNFLWQARLLSNCTSYTFASRSSGSDLESSLLHSSSILLTLQAERAQLNQDSSSLLARNETLERRVTELQRILQEEKDKATQRYIQHQTQLASRPLNRETTRSGSYRPQPSIKQTGLGVTFPPEDSDPNFNLALQLQQTFDRENGELIAQRNALLKTAQRQYHCGICLDDFPEDDAVHIDACGHDICRDCTRGHVCTKIDEHRFAVLCPVCMADQGNRNPGSMYLPITTAIFIQTGHHY